MILQKIPLLIGIALFTSMAWHSSHAAQPSTRSKQKQAAEAERAALREKLAALKQEIHQTEAAREHAADALAESEAAISNANRSLRELAQEQKEAAAQLAALAVEERELKKTVGKQQQQLAGLLREQYIVGREDWMKLLLSGDNPNHITRDLHYLAYISATHAKLLKNLHHNLETVEKNKTETARLNQELAEIAEEERAQKKVLEQEKEKRAKLLAHLSSKLKTQRGRADSIERDDQRLAKLVNRLSKLVEQQRKADLARPVPERPRSSENREGSSSSAKAPVYNRMTPEAGSSKGAAATSFGSLRGKLYLPAKGELVAKYGNKRGDGPSWNGLFIRTEEGAEVKAVAGGQVVFADWLRGFGNLIIIDHGDQYLTIYGNNQSIFKQAGERVNAGDVIASTGDSGGSEQSGLYFEMRHQGRPFDPLGWVTIR